KQQQQQQQTQQQQTQAQNAPAASTPGATTATQRVTLMETTTSMSNFSQEAIPASVFEIPAGYKQVKSPMMQ
ncbi:MAG: hypothetical protein WBV33_11040, partial [Terracidiphilus sp.]